MNWFAFQRSPSGRLVPVAFDEFPDPRHSLSQNVIKETIREIPEDMRGANLAELTAKFHVEKESHGHGNQK